jgi:hypothetical protein
MEQDPRVREFVGLFNQEKFFEAHEALEILWRDPAAAHKKFYQGLIQIAACLVHVQSGNLPGAEALFKSAVSKLEPYRPFFSGMDLDRLVRETQGRVFGSGGFPKIRFDKRQAG